MRWMLRVTVIWPLYVVGAVLLAPTLIVHLATLRMSCRAHLLGWRRLEWTLEFIVSAVGFCNVFVIVWPVSYVIAAGLCIARGSG